MDPDNAEDGPRLVFPSLKEQLSGLTSIKVTNSDGNSVSILKQEVVGCWKKSQATTSTFRSSPGF